MGREAALDFYNSVSGEIYLKSIYDRYWLPLDGGRSVLVVSTSSAEAAYWVVAYTVLVTMIFMAACELATLVVLTWFTAGGSGTRHAMLVSYYNAGSPSRIIPLMTGYIYSGLFRCRRAGKWAVDWMAVKASLLLFVVAFSLLSGDLLTRFFLGGKALIKGNIAQANPKAVFYPDFDGAVIQNLRDAYKPVRAPAVYQAIARRRSMGQRKLQSHIFFDQESTQLPNHTWSWKFNYGYDISGYDLGLRDAPELVFTVNGSCETSYAENSVRPLSRRNFSQAMAPEEADAYPLWGDISTYTQTWAMTVVMIDRENYTAPWAFYLTDTNPDNATQAQLNGGSVFELVPHTAHRVSKSQNLEDPWYQTELNPAWVQADASKVGTDPFITQYRVKNLRPPMRCIQNDTFSYNGAKVKHVDNLAHLPGLKVSNFTRFVLGRELGEPVLAAILSYAPFSSLSSGVHFIANQRRLDAQRANMTRDFRELVQLSYIYSREVIRNTVLLFPSLEQELGLGTGMEEMILNAARNHSGSDFLVDSADVAALSVVTLIVTPAVCVLLWIVVLSWTWLFTSQLKLDNTSASGRHNLRRAGLQAAHLYRFLDEALSQERKWSGRNTNTPFIRDLETVALHDTESISNMQFQSISHLVSATNGMLQVRSEFPKPKLVEVTTPEDVVDDAIETKKGVWSSIKRTVFGRGGEDRAQYEVKMTKAWDREIPAVRRGSILMNV